MPDEMLSERPLPEVTPLTEPFWAAAREGRLVVQRCEACHAHQFPPEVACTHCGAPNLAWTPVSGRATLYSWTVAHPPLLPYFAERAPWPVVAVQLEEGPRLVTNLLDVPVEEYEFGMPLVAEFEPVSDDVTLVVFRREA
jgi:uncharacterized OB-fold protein